MLRLTIVKSTIKNRTLQQMQLLIVDADLLSTPNFNSTSRHYQKDFAFKNYILQSLL